MLRKLREKIKVNNEFNTGNIIASIAVIATIVGFEMKQTEQVARNTAQLMEHQRLIASIVEDQKESARERKDQAIAMADMARLMDEIRRKLDIR